MEQAATVSCTMKSCRQQNGHLQLLNNSVNCTKLLFGETTTAQTRDQISVVQDGKKADY